MIQITAKGENAGKISFYLGKHPDNPFIRETKYGVVEFKFTQYQEDFAKCYLEFHPDGLALVKESNFYSLDQYINDREFSLSSIFLSNFRNNIGHVLKPDHEAAKVQFDMEVVVGPLSTTVPEKVVEELFTPLGYEVDMNRIEMSYDFEMSGGKVKALEIVLRKKTDLVSLFQTLFVMIPVIDNYKHYKTDDTDIEKLLRYADTWIEEHPKKDFILKRFLSYNKKLLEEASDRLEARAESNEEETDEEAPKKERLGELRYGEFVRKILESGVKQIVDMGAGSGNLVRRLIQENGLREIIACEPTARGLEKMSLMLEILTRQNLVKTKPEIFQSSLFYKDDRLVGKECLVLCEVIEHIDEDRIDGVMETILSYYEPSVFILSTPNVEYNVLYEGLKEGWFRHPDHRFEMTREEFQTFVSKHAESFGYAVEFSGVGECHEEHGFPTQMAVLKRSK